MLNEVKHLAVYPGYLIDRLSCVRAQRRMKICYFHDRSYAVGSLAGGLEGCKPSKILSFWRLSATFV
ncbi:MAG TPA: hypothetical protein VFU22_07255, partial [Roseiflexaceae bacterium]|nr:hypothetical protein [Roseiflexaceae bacterium]